MLGAVIVTVVVPEAFTEFGDAVQVTPGKVADAEQLVVPNATVPLKLLCAVTVIVAAVELPG